MRALGRFLGILEPGAAVRAGSRLDVVHGSTSTTHFPGFNRLRHNESSSQDAQKFHSVVVKVMMLVSDASFYNQSRIEISGWRRGPLKRQPMIHQGIGILTCFVDRAISQYPLDRNGCTAGLPDVSQTIDGMQAA